MRLGIIGGLGPMATAYFMELLVGMTDVEVDQEHIESIVLNCPQIPDRTAYILGKSEENPLPSIVECGIKLKELGVDIIAIPCITAHHFYDEMVSKIGIPVINAVKETLNECKNRHVRKVGILATDGTIQSHIFQNMFEKEGIEVVIPNSFYQEKVMNLIYKDVKSGKKPVMDDFYQVADYLRVNGTEVIVLGCTELSLIKKEYDLGKDVIDVMEILSKVAIESCGREVKNM